MLVWWWQPRWWWWSRWLLSLLRWWLPLLMITVKMIIVMFCIIYCSIPLLIICLLFFLKHVPLVEFVYLVFTRVPGESYRRRLRSFVVVIVWRLSGAVADSLSAKYLFHSFTCLSVVSSTDEGDPEDDVMNASPYRDNQINPTQAPCGFLSSYEPSDNTTVRTWYKT